ncbi:unnamed protein product [Pseudo-nitzschia multistriata]|uniref:Sugar phosphate transporter domain-containing protein n=1 Tax=Pseudo-nitzschia multistriata TaxID=183589 RepID=A0A448ZT76_9STRA|nr:unnamed protein product [Pseudo-nitzschia multistriata]
MKRTNKRSTDLPPLELSSKDDDSFERDEEATQPSQKNAPRLVPPSVIYATIYFVCMIVVDFTIEGTQNAFPELHALPYAMTLFQFGWCFFLPVVISKGDSIKNLPKTTIEISPYIILSLVVFSSNVCKSASARYVSFPTKVIFRSTKLIPVMIVASILNINDNRTYGRSDFLAAALLCAGAAGYSFGEHSLNDDKKDSYFGILLLTGSVLCDAFTPNIQQWLMHPATESPGQKRKNSLQSLPSSSSLSSLTPSLPDIIISDSSTGRENETVVAPRFFSRGPGILKKRGLGLSVSTLMTNAYAVGCIGLLLFMGVTHRLEDAIVEAMVRPHLFGNLTLIGVSLSVAVFARTRLIKESGAVTAVTVTTLREFVTVLLSYLIYPKIFSKLHAVSALLVFGGILLSSYSESQTGHEASGNGGKRNAVAGSAIPTRIK